MALLDARHAVSRNWLEKRSKRTWCEPLVVDGRHLDHPIRGSQMMELRGVPSIGSTMRMSCVGRKGRPNCRNRGAKSMTREEPVEA